MENARYIVAVEDADGEKVDGSAFGNEGEARREAERLLRDPAYEGCTVWLTYPGGLTQELTAD